MLVAATIYHYPRWSGADGVNWGVVFSSLELVKELMLSATTKTGLEVDVTILDKVYETGRKVSAAFKKQMRVDSLH